MRKILLLGSALVGLLASGATYAQDKPVAPADATTAQESTPTDQAGLADIVVTAQRRSENLQKAALAVSAVSQDTLINAGVTDPSALTKVVPSLQVKPAAGPYPLFYLRGVGNFNGNGLSDSAIAFNVDNVYIGRPSSSGGFFYDLERIEVLKGPQGTLYGRNATGGAINVITKKPELGTFGGYAVGDYGNYNAINLQGAVNVPLGANAAFRVSGQYAKHDGYLSDGTSDEDGLAFRGSLLVKPSDVLTIRLTGDYYRQKGRGVGSSLIGAGADATGTVLPSGLSSSTGLGDPAAGAIFSHQLVFTGGNFLAPLPNDSFLNNKFWGVSANIDWKTEIGTITIIPAWRKAELNFRNTLPGFLINQRENDEQFSLEARYASRDDVPLRWLFGAYFLKENIDVPLTSFNQQFNASYQSYTSGLNTMAAFGRLTWAITDRFRLTGGLRYTVEDKSLDGTLYGATILCSGTVAPGTTPPTFCFGGPRLPNTAAPPAQLVAPNGQAIPFQLYGFGSPFPGGPATTPVFLAGSQINLNRKASFEKATWRAGAEWDVGPRSLLYASFEKGYKSGGFFFTSDNPVYRPEQIAAWTIGSKNRFLDNRLQLNVEAFYWKYSNQQISHVSRDSAGIVIFATENVGKAEMKGVEVESLFKPFRHTQLSANVQYLDSVYKDFTYTVPNFGAPPIAKCAATAQGAVYRLDCSGKRPPNAPEWTIGLGVDQTIPLGDYQITLTGRTNWQSRTLASLEFQDVQYQAPYWRSDASIGFGDAGGRYTITAFVNNIEDKRVLGTATPHPLVPMISSSLSAPRTYGLRAAVNF